VLCCACVWCGLVCLCCVVRNLFVLYGTEEVLTTFQEYFGNLIIVLFRGCASCNTRTNVPSARVNTATFGRYVIEVLNENYERPVA
jgi:hypothetical protein